MQNCKQCNTGFEITAKDRQFYGKISVPEPTLCPDCRQQRRLAHQNQINLYKRKCDATGEDIISVFAPGGPIKVYGQPYWWSDKWDAMDFGRDFDFNRPFFEQWHELTKLAPRPALLTLYEFNENSEYTNDAGYNKNCYMLFDSDFNWDCYYGHGVNKSKNCMDNTRIKECELCYECVDCVKSYGLKYSQDCDNCSNSAFLKNCIGCKNCFMCSNIKNKEYFVFNKKYDKATFEKLMKSLSKHSELQKYFKDWDTFKLKYPQKYMHGVQNENVVGDYVVYSKDCENCFDSMEMRDCKYFFRCFGEANDCVDCDECGVKITNFYECLLGGYNCQNFRFCNSSLHESYNLDYCLNCMFSSDCFGCVSLRRKKYCILNKQYSKEEYEDMKKRIIEYMKKTGEWGEFFPASLSPFAYNETVAQEYYPLTKEETLKRGYRWREKDKMEYKPGIAKVQDDSNEAGQLICDEMFTCEDCGRNYKIIEQELKFYKEQGVPVPKKCFYCRHANRFNMRNKRILYDRKCDNCGTAIKTTYAPEQPEKVFCEKCYLVSME